MNTAKKNAHHSLGRRVDDWLERARELGPFWPSMTRQLALQADVRRFCESAGCANTIVREAEDQRLLWFAGSSAQAAKLRNLRASLRDHLQARGWRFDEVVVRLEPAVNAQYSGRATPPPKPKARVKPGMPSQSVEGWRELATEMPEGKLRDAIDALIKHHQKK